MGCEGPCRLLLGQRHSEEPHQSAGPWAGAQGATSRFRGKNSGRELTSIQEFEAKGSMTESIPFPGCFWEANCMWEVWKQENPGAIKQMRNGVLEQADKGEISILFGDDHNRAHW